MSTGFEIARSRRSSPSPPARCLLTAAPAQAAAARRAGDACWLDADNGVARSASTMRPRLRMRWSTDRADPGRKDLGLAARPRRRRARELRARPLLRRRELHRHHVCVITSSSSTICATAGEVRQPRRRSNNRVSSFHSYYGCATRIYENTGGRCLVRLLRRTPRPSARWTTGLVVPDHLMIRKGPSRRRGGPFPRPRNNFGPDVRFGRFRDST